MSTFKQYAKSRQAFLSAQEQLRFDLESAQSLKYQIAFETLCLQEGQIYQYGNELYTLSSAEEMAEFDINNLDGDLYCSYQNGMPCIAVNLYGYKGNSDELSYIECINVTSLRFEDLL